MSFVSLFATPNFISVMSDGRVSNYEREEDYQKFRMISPNQFIAIIGDRTRSDAIYDFVKYSEKSCNLSQVGRNVRSCLKRNHNNPFVNIIIGGINGDSIYYQQFDTNNLMNIDLGPNGSSRILFMNSANLDRDYWGKMFMDELSKVNFNDPLEVKRIQELMNDRISDVDSTVNKIKFNEIIEL